MADTRNCEQCGVVFAPRREHARFCSARCRVTWNRRHASGSPADTGALDWALIAMRDTISRLLRAGGWDRADGFAVISEAVWWVTMVDDADHADFVQPAEPGPGTLTPPVAGWTWRPVREPALPTLSERGREWELTRYHAYQAQLAGRPVGETFTQAADFLGLIAEGGLSRT